GFLIRQIVEYRRGCRSNEKGPQNPRKDNRAYIRCSHWPNIHTEFLEALLRRGPKRPRVLRTSIRHGDTVGRASVAASAMRRKSRRFAPYSSNAVHPRRNISSIVR